MVNSESFEHADRMRSFEIIAELKDENRQHILYSVLPVFI